LLFTVLSINLEDGYRRVSPAKSKTAEKEKKKKKKEAMKK
jgi:hypothetical protein